VDYKKTRGAAGCMVMYHKKCLPVCVSGAERRSNYLRAAAEKRQQSEKKSGALASQYVITYEILS